MIVLGSGRQNTIYIKAIQSTAPIAIGYENLPRWNRLALV
jgi:hypothetical protein